MCSFVIGKKIIIIYIYLNFFLNFWKTFSIYSIYFEWNSRKVQMQSYTNQWERMIAYKVMVKWWSSMIAYKVKTLHKSISKV